MLQPMHMYKSGVYSSALLHFLDKPSTSTQLAGKDSMSCTNIAGGINTVLEPLDSNLCLIWISMA